MRPEWPYRFPPNRRAEASTLCEQALKCAEEAGEVLQAVDDEEPESRVAEEAWDCIQACEGVLRKLPKMVVVLALAKTKVKCWRRGDYA